MKNRCCAARQARSLPRLFLAAALVALALTLVPAGAGGVWPPWAKEEDVPDPVYPEVVVDAAWLIGHVGDRDLVVLDVRGSDAYEAGHVPGALHVPDAWLSEVPASPSPENVAASLARLGIQGSERCVVVGEGLSDRAALVHWMLEAAGADEPAVLDGGFAAWITAGGASETGSGGRSPATWGPDPVTDRHAPLDHVVASYGEDGFEIVDTRGWDAWEAGHVPHSLPFDFEEFEDRNGRLLPGEQCRDIFAMLGPRPASPVDLQDEFIVHGAGGADGALGYLLLRHAGIASVRYFPGGWGEWSSQTDLPVVRFIPGEELKEIVTAGNRWPWQDRPTESLVLFDVRHPSDYARGHIPGAVVLTSRLFADSLDIYLERHWPDADRAATPIVTYCYSPSCIRSRLTSTVAARAGFRNVWRFYGGLSEWRQIGGRIAE